MHSRRATRSSGVRSVASSDGHFQPSRYGERARSAEEHRCTALRFAPAAATTATSAISAISATAAAATAERDDDDATRSKEDGADGGGA
jgi:hypothetical protein